MGIDFTRYNRIILVGSPGGGKSWLSKKIAEITKHPLYHLDVEFWKPNWVMTPNDEKITRLNEIISGEKWIIDGNYGGTMEMRYAVADLIIYLDINRFVRIWRVARRAGKKRSDLPDYLDEPNIFNKEFYKFVAWIWNYRKEGGKRVMDLHEKYPEKEFLHIKNRRQVKKLLKR